MDATWLADEAQKLHAIFQNAFFGMVVTFLLVAVVMEFFKLPVGESPVFTSLIGRCLIATLLLIALPEIMNIVADATDSISKEIGDLNNYKLVLYRLGEKLKDLAFSWTSVRDMITIVISFLSFFLLYVTVYFADAAFLYCWVLIYVFSPFVFALYVFPRTAGATSALFRSILEVSLWKVCWSVMATLLWSTALSDINKPDANIDWLTSIVWNLMLMISVLMTPKLVHALLSGGFAELSSGIQGAAMNAVSMTPPVALAKAKAGLMFLPKKVGVFAAKQASKTTGKVWDQAKKKTTEKLPKYLREKFNSSSTQTKYQKTKPESKAPSSDKRGHS